MAVNPLHPSVAGRGAFPAPPEPAAPHRPGRVLLDTSAARKAERACCCLAKPAVIAVMPPSPGRLYPTDLLLCGHHYRASRQALAPAMVLDLNGVRLDDDAWPEARADT
jgi:hypothetical protein